ncbi:MAG: sensor histidine kinase [Actinomycetota bacterium]|nr:sensor histidine kinase [Actinomycetota bacterium]
MFVITPPRLSDAVLALVLAAVGLLTLSIVPSQPPFREPDAPAILVTVAQTLPVAFRRTAPGGILAVVLSATVAYFVLGYPPSTGPIIGLVVATYSVAAYGAPAVSRLGVLAGVAAMTAVVVAGGLTGYETSAIDVVTLAGPVAVAWVVGDRAGARRAHTESLERRATEAERRREAEAAAAVATERTRIARELHDVVAHSVSAMVLHTGAAKAVLESDPEAARRSLELIETTGRQSVAELRLLLDALRSDDGADEGREPQPRTADLSRLIDQARKTGLDVDLEIEGRLPSLPAPVDLSVYRIVQEALTNTIKHARATQARVVLRFNEDRLVLQIVDDGTASRGAGTEGYGLVGMRERASLLGGTLEARPRPNGGFEVFAVLPLKGAP